MSGPFICSGQFGKNNVRVGGVICEETQISEARLSLSVPRLGGATRLITGLLARRQPAIRQFILLTKNNIVLILLAAAKLTDE